MASPATQCPSYLCPYCGNAGIDLKTCCARNKHAVFLPLLGVKVEVRISSAKVFVQINEKWIWALGNHCVLTQGLYYVIRSTAVLIFLSVLFPICD